MNIRRRANAYIGRFSADELARLYEKVAANVRSSNRGARLIGCGRVCLIVEDKRITGGRSL